MATDPTNRARDIEISHLPDPCQDADALLVKAERCRRLAAGISDRQTSDILKNMADNYQQAADRLTSGG